MALSSITTLHIESFLLLYDSNPRCGYHLFPWEHGVGLYVMARVQSGIYIVPWIIRDTVWVGKKTEIKNRVMGRESPLVSLIPWYRIWRNLKISNFVPSPELCSMDIFQGWKKYLKIFFFSLICAFKYWVLNHLTNSPPYLCFLLPEDGAFYEEGGKTKLSSENKQKMATLQFRFN